VNERGPFSLYDWLKYCPSCGKEVPRGEDPWQLTCPHCGFRWFLNPVVGVAGLLHDGAGQILLTRRAKDPAKGMLDFPGGFADPGERAEECLRREVREEIGLPLGTMTYLTSWPNRYRYADVTYTTMDLIFAAEVDRAANHSVDLDEVSALEWHDAATLDPEQLSFPSLRRALRLWRAETVD